MSVPAAVNLVGLAAGTGGAVGVTVDGRSAPLSSLIGGAESAGEWLSFRWSLAPAGLATRRQLAACGQRPGGVEPVAGLSWRRGRRIAYLYPLATAKPKRPMTPAKAAALAAAMRARRTCPGCGRDAGYCIPLSLGVCLDCDDARQATTTYDHDDHASRPDARCDAPAARPALAA